MEGPWEGPQAIGLLALRFIIPKRLVKKSGQLSLHAIVSLKIFNVNPENLLYKKFYGLEKKVQPFLKKKSFVSISCTTKKLWLWTSHLVSVSQDFVCEMMVVKSTLVESIILSVSFCWGSAPSLH